MVELVLKSQGLPCGRARMLQWCVLAPPCGIARPQSIIALSHDRARAKRIEWSLVSKKPTYIIWWSIQPHSSQALPFGRPRIHSTLALLPGRASIRVCWSLIGTKCLREDIFLQYEWHLYLLSGLIRLSNCKCEGAQFILEDKVWIRLIQAPSCTSS